MKFPPLCGCALFVAVGCVAPPEESTLDEIVRGPKLDGELWATSQANGVEYVINKHGAIVSQLALPGAGPHITTFPPSQDFAYIGGMLDGKVYVVDADTHDVVTTLQAGPTLTHQVRASPDGKTLLVSVISTKSVVRIDADEHHRTWTLGPSVSTASFGMPPICTIFRNDGKRAYATLNPSGIAIIDVPTMTIIGSLPTDGFIACGIIKSRDGSHAVLASSGGGGHIYTLNLNNDTLTDRGTLGAASWHSFIMTEDEKVVFGSSPLSDEVIVIDLTKNPVQKVGTIVGAALPTVGGNQPDGLGGGELLTGDTLAVSLRAAGQIAFVDVKRRNIIEYLPIASPSTFNPQTCEGCAVHGITIRHPQHGNGHGHGGCDNSGHFDD